MWVCPRCNEPHEDHFQICWKCASQDQAEGVPTDTAPSAPARPAERRLRSTSSILIRAAVAFVCGMILGGASAHRVAPMLFGVRFENSGISGPFALALMTGTVCAVLVGVFIWVAFPYEPLPDQKKNVDSPSS